MYFNEKLNIIFNVYNICVILVEFGIEKNQNQFIVVHMKQLKKCFSDVWQLKNNTIPKIIFFSCNVIAAN